MMTKVRLSRKVEREVQERRTTELYDLVLSDVRIDFRQHRITANVDQLDEEIVLWQGDTADDLLRNKGVTGIVESIKARLRSVLEEGDTETR